MKSKDMNIGFGMQNIITELKRKDVLANFFTDVTKFIISMVKNYLIRFLLSTMLLGIL